MLENEVLSKIPCSVYNQRQPVVNISLSPLDVEELKQKHGVAEEDILGLIDFFSNINIQSASISLLNDRNVTIDANGTITCKQTNIEEKEEQSPMI